MNKTLGIWGFGVVGISALRFFSRRQWHIQVMDNRQLSTEQQSLVNQVNATFIDQTPESIEQFFTANAYILASPGIDLRPYAQYKHKFLTELDLFGKACVQPIVAITGSVGKTTVTHLLSTLLTAQGMHTFTGGNIGTGMLDMIDHQVYYDCAVIEVSSFQLEYCKTFAPDLAIITNVYPNHLDRHGTLENYFTAKYQVAAHQGIGQQSLIPFEFRAQLPVTETVRNYFTHLPITDEQCASLSAREALFYYTDSHIMKYHNGSHTPVITRAELPTISFELNWLILCAALTILRVPLQVIAQLPDENTLPEHRLELVATIAGATFYNDSKSTLAQSTLAAIDRLKGKSIILFLGGVSKGVSRETLIQALPSDVQEVYCFGAEADQLHRWCVKYNKVAYAFTTLDDAFSTVTKKLAPQMCILFSPAGTSYDLFAHYEERGNYFKKLVTTILV